MQLYSIRPRLFIAGQGHILGLLRRGDISMRRDRHTAPTPLSAREDDQQYDMCSSSPCHRT